MFYKLTIICNYICTLVWSYFLIRYAGCASCFPVLLNGCTLLPLYTMHFCYKYCLCCCTLKRSFIFFFIIGINRKGLKRPFSLPQIKRDLSVRNAHCRYIVVVGCLDPSNHFAVKSLLRVCMHRPVLIGKCSLLS